MSDKIENIINDKKEYISDEHKCSVCNFNKKVGSTFVWMFSKENIFFLPWEPDGLFTTLYILLFLSFSDDSIINSSAEEYSSGTFVESSLTETIIWSSLIILFCDDC